MFLGYALYAGWIWKGDVLVADLKELETMDASEIYSKKTQCERGDISQRNRKIIFPTWRRSWPENTHLDMGTPNSRRKSQRFSWRIRRVSSTTSRLTSGCRWSEKWFLVHVRKLHIPPSRWTPSQTLLAERRIIPYSTKIQWRIQNYSYKLGCQARTTHRWLLEYRWSRDLSDSWTGFTRFTLLEEKPPEGQMWSGARLTRKQLTSRPDHLWPELWEKMGKNANLKERQKWSHEKPKLDNIRKLWGIHFIYPEDKDFKETIKNARKKLETSVAPAMPCKISKNNQNCGNGDKYNKVRSKLACILEAGESRRLRMGESLPNHHEDHIAERGDNSLQHYNLVHKFIPMHQAVKIPAAKAAVDKEWENWRKFMRGTWRKSEVRKKWSMKQGRRAQEFISPHWWTSVIWRMPNWRRSTKNTKVELYSEVIL